MHCIPQYPPGIKSCVATLSTEPPFWRTCCPQQGGLTAGAAPNDAELSIHVETPENSTRELEKFVPDMFKHLTVASFRERKARSNHVIVSR